MKTLTENTLFKNLTASFDRSPDQINSVLQSDSELIKLANGVVLAITTDCIVEEIETGLYDDPYMIGWMTVTVNLSDISAVGARPLGLLLQENLPYNYPDDKLQLLQKGISDGCKAHKTFVVGGDTNHGKGFQMGGTAIGLIEDGPVISRQGCNVGDQLFISGKMGLGNAYGFSKILASDNKIPVCYLPIANPAQGEIIRHHGSCCMDTSDGFFPAICNLMEMNKIGFEMSTKMKYLLCEEASEMSHSYKVPSWFFLTGPHGEYKLLFTVPEHKCPMFLKDANLIKWEPIAIGKVIPEYSFLIKDYQRSKNIDPFQIANLFEACGNDPKTYLGELMKINYLWKRQN